MGPDTPTRGMRHEELPSRPKFGWDTKNVPWTDGIGPQDRYAEAVQLWCCYHDMLPLNSTNRIAKKVRGILLKSQLFGRARDLVRSLDWSLIQSEEGAEHIVRAIHKSDPLTLLSDIFGDFNRLIVARRGESESFKGFEGRFAALVSKFNSHSVNTSLPESLTAFLLLFCARVDDTQRISILSAASKDLSAKPRFSSLTNPLATPSPYVDASTPPPANEDDAAAPVAPVVPTTPGGTVIPTLDDFNNVKYETVASILRQCESRRQSTPPTHHHTNHNLNAHNSHATSLVPSRRGGRGGGNSDRRTTKRRMTANELWLAKMTQACSRCKKYGHWSRDHNPDGSLKPASISLDSPLVGNNANTNNSAPQQNDNGQHTSPQAPPNNAQHMPPSGDGKPKIAHGFTSSLSASLSTPQVLVANASRCHQQSDNRFNETGPLVDDGAPFSAIGEVELNLLRSRLEYVSPSLLDKPPQLQQFDSWQFGVGEHASAARAILGSVEICVRTDSHKLVSIRHLVIAGSSNWIVGRNVTRACNIVHVGNNAIQLPHSNDSITMIDSDYHSYIPMSALLRASSASTMTVSLCSHLVNPVSIRPHQSQVDVAAAEKHPVNRSTVRFPWTDARRVVDRVHRHVCGHASYSDMRTLLIRNGIWSQQVQSYLAQTVSECNKCVASASPPPNRRVSLASLDREFNTVVCVDHFFLDDHVLFHIMDTSTRYSAAAIVSSTNLTEAIRAFETLWISQFWAPQSVHADGAFQQPKFVDYLARHAISIRPVPPRRHQKNMIEPRHGSIRAIFLRLRQHDDKFPSDLCALEAVRLSNDLYGTDVASAFELAKGYTRPLHPKSHVCPIPPEIVEAHVDLLAKRKLHLIMRTQVSPSQTFDVGDLVEIYIKNEHGKRGRWSSPRLVTSVNREAGFITVPGKRGHTCNAAFEDVRLAVEDDTFAYSIQSAIDTLDDSISASIDDDLDDNDCDEQYQDAATNNDDDDHHGQVSMDDQQSALSDTSSVDSLDITQRVDANDKRQQLKESKQRAPPRRGHDDEFDDVNLRTPAPGDRVEIYWPLDDRYYAGQVRDILNDGRHFIVYDDDDDEKLFLESETWRFEHAASANQIELIKSLESNEQEVLNSLLDAFGMKPFLLHQCEGFDQHVIMKAYDKEERSYLEHVQPAQRRQIPHDANIVRSHVVYKLKVEDDGSLKLKARIAPHGNEDSEMHDLRRDCAMCPPTGMRIIFFMAACKRWRLVKADSKMAFHQTGLANRQVYVHPPKESRRKGELWLLMVAGYGLVNAGAKWQKHSDQIFYDLGLSHVPEISQLFVRTTNDVTTLLVAKIVDDVLATGVQEQLEWFIKAFSERSELGTITWCPGAMQFFGLSLHQDEDFSVSIHADDKLNAIEAYPLSRVRRKNADDKLNAVELSSFKSVNSSISWIGTTASLFCSFYSSHLQQKLPDVRVRHLTEQATILHLLKRLGSLTVYPTVKPGSSDDLHLVAFADASHAADGSQLCHVIGLFIGPVALGSTFHLMSWSSHKSRRPCKSTPAAEILAASEAIDELVAIHAVLVRLLGVPIRLWELVDSKDLYHSLSTQRQSVDRSVRNDVNCIRFTFETVLDVFAWIKGAVNMADVGTKRNSALTDAVNVIFATGRFDLDLSSIETRSHQRNLG